MIIKKFYCPVCKEEIFGLGWKKGKMSACPHCRRPIADLNKNHIDQFTEHMAMAIMGGIFSLIFSIVGFFQNIGVFLIFCCFFILAVVIFIVLYSRRQKSR